MTRTTKIAGNPKKAKALPDLTAPPAAPTNGPDREEALFMMGQFLAAEQVLRDARNARKRLRNQAKLRGFELEQFDRALAVREQRDDDTTLEQLKTFKRYCEYLGLPVGTQLQFFNDGKRKRPAFSEESLQKKAYDEGYELGVMGKNPDHQAYPGMTPEGNEHLRGWNDGQKVNFDKFGKLNADMAAVDAERAKKAAKKKAADETPAEDEKETKH